MLRPVAWKNFTCSVDVSTWEDQLDASITALRESESHRKIAHEKGCKNAEEYTSWFISSRAFLREVYRQRIGSEMPDRRFTIHEPKWG